MARRAAAAGGMDDIRQHAGARVEAVFVGAGASDPVVSRAAAMGHRVFDLAPGEWDGPLVSSFGVHLVRVAQVIPARQPALDEVRDQVMTVVRAHFRPEFLNRVDEIILFHRLRRSDMGKIVDIQLRRLQKLLEDRKITITLDASARDWLAEKGYDPAYGARPLKRAIQKALQDPLAELILEGAIRDGETITVTATKQGLAFNGKVAAAA